MDGHGDDENKGMEVAERGVDAFINQADNLCRAGKNEEAIQYLDRALKLSERKLGPNHPKTALARTKRSVAPRLHSQGPTNGGLHFEFFDHQTEEFTYRGNYEIGRILRNRHFVEENSVAATLEFDAHDPTARHCLGLVGDAPVIYARWRMETTIEGNMAVIDRLCTLEAYRRRGFARGCMETLIQDVARSGQERNLQLMAIMAIVPMTAVVLLQKLQVANFVPAGECQDRGVACMRMCMHATPVSAS
jgi:predicted GNAT family N-acyltransferase